MAIIRRAVKGSRLTSAEYDANMDPLDQVTPIILTIASGAITIPSSGSSPAPGVYRLLPQTAPNGTLTQISGGIGHEEEIVLRLNTVGHVITVTHTSPNLRLSTATFLLNSVYDSIVLRSPAAGVWAEVSRSSVPP